jgi:hypothetical protein
MPDEPEKKNALLPRLKNMLAEAKAIARRQMEEIQRCQAAAADPLERRHLESCMNAGESPAPPIVRQGAINVVSTGSVL